MTNTAPRILPDEQDDKAIHTVSAGVMPIRYVLYTRKSSEDDERQALSIDSQMERVVGISTTGSPRLA